MVECYTDFMSESGNKDSIKPLFQPMPSEFTGNSSTLPKDVPLSQQERREAVDWLLSPEGGVSVTLRDPYNTPETRDILIESMLMNGWFLPDPALGNRIPLKGSSGHKVGSTTIPLQIAEEATGRRVDIVAKPFAEKHSKAEMELERYQQVQRRGVATLEPLGFIDVNDSQGREVYELTILRRNIIPLQKINFEQLDTDKKFTQLKDFLHDLGEFVANMHNQGVTHGDLHLGNIAADLSQETAAGFVVLDLEKASIMSSSDLSIKNKTSTSAAQRYLRKFAIFEDKASKDLGTLVAQIQERNKGISYDTLLFQLVTAYFNARTPSHGLPTQEDFIQAFDQGYKRELPTVKKIVDRQKAGLESLTEE